MLSTLAGCARILFSETSEAAATCTIMCPLFKPPLGARKAGNSLIAGLIIFEKESGLPNAQPVNVLVVDDDEEIREIIQSNLKVFGFGSEEAASASEAILKIENGQFDIVISDIKMPGEDGLFLLQELKNKDVNKPIIFLVSAYSEY